jgi:hypothetical protein
MKIAWKAITDADVARLERDYDLTETELMILQLRRKGVNYTAISLKTHYSISRMYAISEKLTLKIMQMYQDKG